MARERTFAPTLEPESAGSAAAGPEGGRPLDTAIRAEMERGFGERFSDVRLHDDPAGGQSAQRLGVRAYTYGRDIYFVPGAYQPDEPSGRRLLAHELAHVIQQGQGQRASDSPDQVAGSAGGPTAGQPIAAAEREADAAAETVAQGGTARVTPGSVPPQIQPALEERESNDPIFATYSLGPTRAGNIAEVPVVLRYAERFGDDHVYFGAVRTGGLALASFFGKSEADRKQIAKYIGSGTRPDIVDTRTKEVYDVKSRADRGAPAVLEKYMERLDDLYNAYNPVGQIDHPFQVVQPSYLDTRYKLGARFGSVDHMFMPGIGIRAVQQEPGIIAYCYLFDANLVQTNIDKRLISYNVGEQLEKQAKAALLKGIDPVRKPPKLLVTLSPRSVEFDAPEKIAPGDTIKATATKDTRRIFPGLEFGRASLLLGENLTPVGGSVSVVAKLPFAKDKSHELTFTVDADGHAAVTFTSTLRLGALGEVEIHAAMENDLLTARADVTPQPAFLRNVRGQLLYQEGELSGGVTFTPEGLALPIPGLTAENVSGAITFTTESIAGEGAFTLRYQGFGQADVTLRYDKKGLNLDGALNVTIPGLEPVTGTVAYKAGKLTAETRLTKAHFPAGLPLESGSITIRLVDGEIEGSGKLGVQLGPVGKGNLTFGYANGVVEIGAGIDLEVPGLRGGTVLIRYVDGQLAGEGSIPLNTDLLPGLGGNLQVWYREGRFGAETALSYRRGDLQGGVTIRLEQLEDGSLAISGGGEVSAKVAPWLTGRVQVEITRDAAINVHGEIKAPGKIELFPRKPIKKEITIPRIEFPLFGISVPVVGSIGIIAFIEAGGGFELFVGPAVLRNITVAGAFGIDGNPVTGEAAPDGQSPGGGAIGPSFDISGELAMSAGAEVYMFVEGGISLDAAIADISGSIRLRGGLGAVATLGVTPHIGYENGEYYFKGDAELAALAFLRLSGEARASVSVVFYGEVWGESWPLFEWVYPLGLNVGLKGRMEYYFGRPFEPSFEIQTEELDPLAVVKSAFPDTDSKPSNGPSTPPEPRTSMTTEMVPGARPGGGGPVSGLPPAGAAPAMTPAGGPGPKAPPPPATNAPARAPALPPAVKQPPGQPPAQPSKPPIGQPPIGHRPQVPTAPALPGALPPTGQPPTVASQPPQGPPRPPGVPPPIPTRPPATPPSAPPAPRQPGVPPPVPTRPPGTPPPIPTRQQPPPVPMSPSTPTGGLPPGAGQPPPPPPAGANLAAAIKRFWAPSGDLPVVEQPMLARAFGKHNHLGAPFEMEVDFDPASPHVPDLEYRQYVAGRFERSKKGSPTRLPADHTLPDGSLLTPGALKRDGAGGHYYGDRKNLTGRGPSDDYFDEFDQEDRTRGTQYRGADNPGIDVDVNDDLVTVDLEFEGRVVHVPTGQILRRQAWTVTGRHQNP